MVEIGLDTNNIRWQKCYPPPTVSMFLILKLPYSGGAAIFVTVVAWFFIQSWGLAAIIGFFSLFIANVFMSFLAGAAKGKCMQYEIAATGIHVGKKTTPYTELDKNATIAYLKSVQLAYKDWRVVDLVGDGKLTLGKTNLIFTDQVTRQKAIAALLHYLGA